MNKSLEKRNIPYMPYDGLDSMVAQWVRALAISLNDLGLIPGKERTRSHELSSYLHEHVMVCSMCVGVEGQEKQA